MSSMSINSVVKNSHVESSNVRENDRECRFIPNQTSNQCAGNLSFDFYKDIKPNCPLDSQKSDTTVKQRFCMSENIIYDPLLPPLYPWMVQKAKSVQISQEVNESYQNGEKHRRTRSCYSKSQLFELEKEFLMSSYITTTRRAQLAKELALTEKQVKVWFQNRRMKWKKDNGSVVF